MSSRKTLDALKLSALAVAAAAVIIPLAHSGGRAAVVNKANAPSAKAARAAQNDLSDRFIVTYRSAAAAKANASGFNSKLQAASKAVGTSVRMSRSLSTGADLLRTDRKLDPAESKLMMVELMKDPNVLAVEVDARARPLFVPNDPLYAQQWHYKNGAGGVNLEPAWDITKGAGTVVAVLDTGIVPHSDLLGQTVPGYDFIGDIDTAVDGDGRDADPNDPGDWHDGECNFFGIPEDSSWHGTHVSGTIAALTDNGVGVAGVAPQAKILPVRVLGKCGGFFSDIIDGITWSSGGTVAGVPANANPAEVINMSLGGGGACSVAFQTAIDAAVARGTTVVVAAGNSGDDAASEQPASCNNVISVSAVGPTGALASYSNFGPVVDVAGPGGTGANPAGDNVLSTLNLGLTTQGAEGYAWYAGTSMASPHVAGIAALIQAGFDHAANPSPGQEDHRKHRVREWRIPRWLQLRNALRHRRRRRHRCGKSRERYRSVAVRSAAAAAAAAGHRTVQRCDDHRPGSTGRRHVALPAGRTQRRQQPVVRDVRRYRRCRYLREIRCASDQ